MEPPLKFLFFIFPFVILQTLGYVFSLVLCSVYLRAYTFVCIVLLIVSASLHVLCRHLLSLDKGLQFLYQRARFIYFFLNFFFMCWMLTVIISEMIKVVIGLDQCFSTWVPRNLEVPPKYFWVPPII